MRVCNLNNPDFLNFSEGNVSVGVEWYRIIRDLKDEAIGTV
jgi:hypothetical protein